MIASAVWQHAIFRITVVMFAAPSAYAGGDVTRLADGVYAYLRTEPPGLTFVSNTVFIINDDDVVVVDTGVGPAAAAEAIAALKKVDREAGEIRNQYALARRSHDGQRVVSGGVPGVEFIAHDNAEAEMR